MSSSNPDEFYKDLKEKLEAQSSWPTIYLFKFIVKSNSSAQEQIQQVFQKEQKDIELKPSKAQTYTSISIRTMMRSSDAVINKYKEVGKIDGVISL